MKDVFVSYRRSDSAYITGMIFDGLKARLGVERLFKDVDSIPLGKDFREAIGDAVGQCKVLLAIMGDDWLGARDDAGRRIDNPDDYVRLEIATALARGIPVIPVLVERASMPQPSDLPPELEELAFRQATVIRPDPDFHADLERLATQVAAYTQSSSPPRAVARKPTQAAWWAFFAVVVLLALCLAMLVFRGRAAARESLLIGKWEQFALGDDQGHSLGLLDVSRVEGGLEMKVLTQVNENTDAEILSLAHEAFDGEEWRFRSFYRDGVHGSFRLQRISDRVFEGSLTTDNDELPYRHRLVKRD